MSQASGELSMPEKYRRSWIHQRWFYAQNDVDPKKAQSTDCMRRRRRKPETDCKGLVKPDEVQSEKDLKPREITNSEFS
jgi:hypothetical protein